jgi:hypothetical protein
LAIGQLPSDSLLTNRSGLDSVISRWQKRCAGAF